MTEEDWNSWQDELADADDTARSGDGGEDDLCPDGRPCQRTCLNGPCPGELVADDVAECPTCRDYVGHCPCCGRKRPGPSGAGTVDAAPAGGRGEETNPRPPKTAGRAQQARQYVAALRKLGLTPYGAAPHLGISTRMSIRYAAGTHAIPETVAKLVRAMVRLATVDV